VPKRCEERGALQNYIHSFTFNSRLKVKALTVEYNGKNTLTVKIKN